MRRNNYHINGRHWLLIILCCVAAALTLAPSSFATDTLAPAIDYTTSAAVREGKACTLVDPAAADGTAIGDLWENESKLTFNNVDGGAGGMTTILLTYANGATETATTFLTANNGSTTTVELPPTGGWGGSGHFKAVTVPMLLNAGNSNTIVFSATPKALGWVFSKMSIRPVVQKPFSLVSTNAILNATLDYWPYYLLLLLLVSVIIVVKKRNEDA